MAPGRGFASFAHLARFSVAYARLQKDLQKQVDKAVHLLRAHRAHPGLNVHPIQPDKHYWEAYANKSDRIIFIPDGDRLILVDIVSHDQIGKYGKRPKKP
ncbi:MAG TPA: hypothetical protein VFQ39_12130 [Longimicrobium sp.]|nr:hypothetical protein [Longimicrobium sp.]